MIDYDTYAKKLRKKFSNSSMLNNNFDINQNYFRCKYGEFWNDEDYKRLKDVLETMNNKTEYDKIKVHFPNISIIEIRLRIKILSIINKRLI